MCKKVVYENIRHARRVKDQLSDLRQVYYCATCKGYHVSSMTVQAHRRQKGKPSAAGLVAPYDHQGELITLPRVESTLLDWVQIRIGWRPTWQVCRQWVVGWAEAHGFPAESAPILAMLNMNKFVDSLKQ